MDLTTLPQGTFTQASLANWNVYNNLSGRFTPPTAETYEATNITLVNGCLVLTANHTGSTFTSGGMDSKGKTEYLYGTLTASVWLPMRGPVSQTGLWPALWLLSDDSSFEVDIFEAINDEAGVLYSNLHWGSNQDGPARIAALDPEAFHTFVLDWQPSKLTWSIDGQVVKTSTANIPNKSLYLITNLAVGAAGTWPGATNDHTVFPAAMVLQSLTYTPLAATPPPPPVTTPPTTAPKVTDSQLGNAFITFMKAVKGWWS